MMYQFDHGLQQQYMTTYCGIIYQVKNVFYSFSLHSMLNSDEIEVCEN